MCYLVHVGTEAKIHRHGYAFSQKCTKCRRMSANLNMIHNFRSQPPIPPSVFFPYGVEGSGRWSESGVEGSTGATSLRGPGVEGTWAAHHAEPMYLTTIGRKWSHDTLVYTSINYR